MDIIVQKPSVPIVHRYSAPDYAWLLQGLPKEQQNPRAAAAAAIAWDTLRLWMAVCWEYSMALIRAQHALREYYGTPPTWQHAGTAGSKAAEEKAVPLEAPVNYAGDESAASAGAPEPPVKCAASGPGGDEQHEGTAPEDLQENGMEASTAGATEAHTAAHAASSASAEEPGNPTGNAGAGTSAGPASQGQDIAGSDVGAGADALSSAGVREAAEQEEVAPGLSAVGADSDEVAEAGGDSAGAAEPAADEAAGEHSSAVGGSGDLPGAGPVPAGEQPDQDTGEPLHDGATAAGEQQADKSVVVADVGTPGTDATAEAEAADGNAATSQDGTDDGNDLGLPSEQPVSGMDAAAEAPSRDAGITSSDAPSPHQHIDDDGAEQHTHDTSCCGDVQGPQPAAVQGDAAPAGDPAEEVHAAHDEAGEAEQTSGESPAPTEAPGAHQTAADAQAAIEEEAQATNCSTINAEAEVADSDGPRGGEAVPAADQQLDELAAGANVLHQDADVPDAPALDTAAAEGSDVSGDVDTAEPASGSIGGAPDAEHSSPSVDVDDQGKEEEAASPMDAGHHGVQEAASTAEGGTEAADNIAAEDGGAGPVDAGTCGEEDLDSTPEQLPDAADPATDASVHPIVTIEQKEVAASRNSDDAEADCTALGEASAGEEGVKGASEMEARPEAEAVDAIPTVEADIRAPEATGEAAEGEVQGQAGEVSEVEQQAGQDSAGPADAGGGIDTGGAGSTAAEADLGGDDQEDKSAAAGADTPPDPAGDSGEQEAPEAAEGELAGAEPSEQEAEAGSHHQDDSSQPDAEAGGAALEGGASTESDASAPDPDVGADEHAEKAEAGVGEASADADLDTPADRVDTLPQAASVSAGDHGGRDVQQQAEEEEGDVSAAEQQEQAEDAQAQAEGSPADKRSTEDASGGEEATTVASAGAGPLNESGVTATHDDSDDSSGSRAQDSVAAGELGTTQPAGGGDEPQATEAAAPSAGGAVVSPGPGSDQEEQQEEEAPAAAAGSRKPSSSQLSGGATTAHDTAAGLSETEGEGGAPMQPHRDLSPGQQAGPHLVTAALEGQELEAVTAEWEEARQRVAAARAEQPARASSQQVKAERKSPAKPPSLGPAQPLNIVPVDATPPTPLRPEGLPTITEEGGEPGGGGRASRSNSIDGPQFGPAAGGKDEAVQRLRRLLGDVLYESAQGSPGSVPPPATAHIDWAAFAELMAAQGISLTPSDWADLKPFTVVMHRKVHVLWTPLAALLAPDGPQLVPPPKDGRTRQQRLQARLRSAVHSLRPALGGTRWVQWSELRNLMAGQGVQLTGSDWSDLAPLLHVTTHKTAHEGRPVPLTTYVDWEALDAEMGPDGPLWSCMPPPAHPSPPDGPPGSQLLSALAGPLYSALTAPPPPPPPAAHSHARSPPRAAASARLALGSRGRQEQPQGRVSSSGPLRTALSKGRLAFGREISWRTLMAALAKQGVPLDEADPVWWDIKPLMRVDPQSRTTLVDVAALASLLRPDGPSCLSDLFSLDESGLLSSSKGGQEDEQEAAAARLSQLLGPSLRALYLASPALHTSWAISQEVGRASTRHRRGRLPQQGAPGHCAAPSIRPEHLVHWAALGSALAPHNGPTHMSDQTWWDLYTCSTLQVLPASPSTQQQRQQAAPLTTYVDIPALLAVVGPDGPDFTVIGSTSMSRADSTAGRGRHSAALARARMLPVLTDMLIGLHHQQLEAQAQVQRQQSVYHRRQAQQQQAAAAAGIYCWPSCVPKDGLLPWAQFQAVLDEGLSAAASVARCERIQLAEIGGGEAADGGDGGSQEEAQAAAGYPLSGQDWCDIRALGLLTTSPASTFINWAKLTQDFQPRGPEIGAPTPDSRTPDQRLRTRLAPALRVVATGTPPTTHFMHWSDWEMLMGKCGCKLRPSDWGDLHAGRYLSLTTTHNMGGQRPQAHTLYVAYWRLLVALLPSVAAAQRPDLADKLLAPATSPGGDQAVSTSGAAPKEAEETAGAALPLPRTPSLPSNPRPLVATSTMTSHHQHSLSTQHTPSTVQPTRLPGPALERYMYPRSRYSARAPTTAFKSQPAQLDSSLSAQLMDLMARMQGRSIAKPSAQEWAIALSRLEVQIDRDFAEHRKLVQKAHAAAAVTAEAAAASRSRSASPQGRQHPVSPPPGPATEQEGLTHPEAHHLEADGQETTPGGVGAVGSPALPVPGETAPGWGRGYRSVSPLAPGGGAPGGEGQVEPQARRDSRQQTGPGSAHHVHHPVSSITGHSSPIMHQTYVQGRHQAYGYDHDADIFVDDTESVDTDILIGDGPEAHLPHRSRRSGSRDRGPLTQSAGPLRARSRAPSGAAAHHRTHAWAAGSPQPSPAPYTAGPLPMRPSTHLASLGGTPSPRPSTSPRHQVHSTYGLAAEQGSNAVAPSAAGGRQGSPRLHHRPHRGAHNYTGPQSRRSPHQHRHRPYTAVVYKSFDESRDEAAGVLGALEGLFRGPPQVAAVPGRPPVLPARPQTVPPGALRGAAGDQDVGSRGDEHQATTV